MNTTTTEMTNFMGGTSFKLFNPLTRLKLVAFSSFLGEPTYYQKVENELFEKRSKTFDCDITFLKKYLLIPDDIYVSRNQTFYNATISALDFDFKNISNSGSSSKTCRV